MDDQDGAGIEWLDGADAEPFEALVGAGRGPRPGTRRRWWYGLIALALVGLAVAAAVRHRSPASAAAGRAKAGPVAPTPPARASAPKLAGNAPATINPSAATTTPPRVVTVGHSLLGVRAGWEIFTAGAHGVARIQLAAGIVTTTALPDLSADDLVSFVVGADRVLLRPLDDVPGYEVRDGQSATALPAAFSHAGTILPGPDAEHVWVGQDSTPNLLSIPAMALYGLDGTAAGRVSIALPWVGSLPESDAGGYFFFYDSGGVYDAHPSGAQRITSGTLLAAGPTRWLTAECDAQDRCTRTVIDRASGAHYSLPTPVTAVNAVGEISADGRTAALILPDANALGTIHLIDLSSGADRPTGVSVDPNQGNSIDTFVWSPDSAWLFAASGGSLVAVSRATGQPVPLGLTLPAVTQVGVRAARG